MSDLSWRITGLFYDLVPKIGFRCTKTIVGVDEMRALRDEIDRLIDREAARRIRRSLDLSRLPPNTNATKVSA